MLLSNYDISLDYERKQQRLKYGKDFMDEFGGEQIEDGTNLNDSREKGGYGD